MLRCDNPPANRAPGAIAPPLPKCEILQQVTHADAAQPDNTGRNTLDVSTYVVGMLVQQGLTFASGVIVAHTLGPVAFGITSITRNLFALALIMAPLGLDLALLRHINERRAIDAALMGEIALMRRYVATVSVVVLAGAALAFGPMLEHYVYHTAGFSRYLTLAFIAFPFAADTALMAASFRGLHRPIFASIANLYVQPVARILFLIGFIIAGFGISGVILATSCGAIASALVLSISFARFTGRIAGGTPVDAKEQRANVNRVFSYSTWLAATLLMGGLLRSVDVLVLGYFRPSYEVGSYAAIASIAQIIMICPQAASQSLGARIARHFHAGDTARMKRDLQDYLRVAGLMTAPLFGGVAAFGPWLTLVFGTRFDFSASLSLNLSAVYYISAIFAPFGYTLSMTGAHKKELGILAVGAIGAFALCCALAPRYGGNGVAVAITVGYLGMTMARTMVVARRSNIRVGSMADAVPPLACLGAGLLVKHLHDLAFPTLGWFDAAPFVLAYGAMVAAIYRLSILTAGETQYILRCVRKAIPPRTKEIA